MSLDGSLVNKWLFDYMGCLIYKDLYSFYYGMPEFVNIQNLKNILLALEGLIRIFCEIRLIHLCHTLFSIFKEG